MIRSPGTFADALSAADLRTQTEAEPIQPCEIAQTKVEKKLSDDEFTDHLRGKKRPRRIARLGPSEPDEGEEFLELADPGVASARGTTSQSPRGHLGGQVALTEAASLRGLCGSVSNRMRRHDIDAFLD